MKWLKLGLLFYSIIILSGSIRAQQWINTWGPEGGTILELVENDGKLYGRTGTNIYVSEDNGDSWTILGGEEFNNITPGNLTSTSFGVHFTTTSSKVSSIYDGSTIEASAEGFGQFEFPAKIIHVKDTLFAVAGANLYKSIDGAKNWIKAGTVGAGDAIFGVDDIVVSSSFTAGIKASFDGGVTFEAFGPTVSFELVNSLAKLDDKYVLATTGGAWAKNTSGEWEKTFIKTGSFSNLAVIEGKIYGLNGSVSVVGGAIVASADVYASADTGKTWTLVEIESDTKPLYGDHNKVVAVGDNLYATAIQKSNALVSTDGGLNWTSLGTEGLRNPLTRGIFPIEDDIYVTTNGGAGTGQYGFGVFKSSDKGTSWSQVSIELPEGHNGSFYTVRKNGENLYACSYAGLFISSDGGDSWSILEGTEEWYISDIHFTENLWIMAGSDGFSRIWTSSDAGANWETHYQGIGAIFETFHVNNDNSGIVIGSNTALIASSQDLGATWQFAANDKGLALGGGYFNIGSIDTMFYTKSNASANIYKSSDHGINWEKATDLEGLKGVTVELIFSNNETLYVYGSTFAIVDGAFVNNYAIYKSTDGVNFEKSIELHGTPKGYSSPMFTFVGDELFLGYSGAPIFKYSSEDVGTVNEEVEFEKDQFILSQNYPNPFNPTTNISFNLPKAGNVTLKVYNMLGQQVATLVNGRMSAGIQVVTFDASQLSSGMYLYQIQSGNYIRTRKMMLIK
ncbi:MAG: T9SS type A sorting domain-containing protein [Balneolaceae bacterium]